MKRELGMARCGPACCLRSENTHCAGCGECADKDWCENRRCSLEKGLAGCRECGEDCRRGLLGKTKPYGLKLFIQRYGVEALVDCLERGEKAGVVYHREGVTGDYDDFDDPEALVAFLRSLP